MIDLRWAALCALVLCVCACALQPQTAAEANSQNASYVAALGPGDGPVIAQSIIRYLNDRLPPASSVIALAPPPTDAPDPDLTPVLSQGLAHAGYGLASAAGGEQTPNDIHQLRYYVTDFNDAILLRLKLDSLLLNCIFIRDTRKALALEGPCTQWGDHP